MKKVLFSALLLAGFVANVQAQDIPEDIKSILQKNTCLACHKADAKLVGPAYKDVAKKGYTKEKIVDLIANPKPSNWPGYPPMAPMKNISKDDAMKVAGWINSLAPAKKGGKKKA
jgi:cytochrome c